LQDLGAKLGKAISGIPNTRATLPNAKGDVKASTGKSTKVKETEDKKDAAAGEKKKEESQLVKGVRDRCVTLLIVRQYFDLVPRLCPRPYSAKIAMEAQHGLIAQVLKDLIFSSRTELKSEDFAVLDSAIASEN
jgi:COP9 signalosome complex subunit 5